jgi:hypothetical protein
MIKMIRRRVSPIEIWLPADCLCDTLVVHREPGETDHEYEEMVAHWRMVFDGLFEVVGEKPDGDSDG